MTPFVPLAERIVDALLASDPSLASSAGDHRYDDRLPDLSTDAVAATATMLLDATNALAEVDADTLSTQERVDHAILSAIVDRRLFELTEVRAREWNPLVYNPGALLHSLIARPFAPAAQRLTSLAGRLGAVPDVLATARDTLRGVPTIHAETAAGQFAGTAALVRDRVSVLLAEEPGLRGTVEPLAAEAAHALDEFAGWLREGLDRDTDRRDRDWGAGCGRPSCGTPWTPS